MALLGLPVSFTALTKIHNNKVVSQFIRMSSGRLPCWIVPSGLCYIHCLIVHQCLAQCLAHSSTQGVC